MEFRLLKLFTKSKTNVFIGIAIIGLFIVLILDFFDTQFKLHDILVEFHGLVFDAIIFGIFVTIYESITEGKEKIERYKEEINDYRFWESEEALYRIRGLVKRLVNLKVKEIDLSHCYLANDSSLSDYLDMRKWKFSNAKLANNSFIMCNLENAVFYFADLSYARFSKANLSYCQFGSAILHNTNFKECIFENTDLSYALTSEQNWFELLEKNNNKGINELKEKYRIESDSTILNEVKLFKIIRK